MPVIFLFSSIKAAVNEVSCNILTEDVIPAPKGPYGESKMLAEKYIQNRKQETGNRKQEDTLPERKAVEGCGLGTWNLKLET